MKLTIVGKPNASGRPRTTILEGLSHDELLAWALEAEQALDRISVLAGESDSNKRRGERFQEIWALANPWSRSRALVEAVREAVR